MVSCRDIFVAGVRHDSDALFPRAKRHGGGHRTHISDCFWELHSHSMPSETMMPCSAPCNSHSKRTVTRGMFVLSCKQQTTLLRLPQHTRTDNPLHVHRDLKNCVVVCNSILRLMREILFCLRTRVCADAKKKHLSSAWMRVKSLHHRRLQPPRAKVAEEHTALFFSRDQYLPDSEEQWLLR